MYHRESRSLIAATYGRSIWRLTNEDLEDGIKAAKSRAAAEALSSARQDTSALNDQLLKLLDCLRHG